MRPLTDVQVELLAAAITHSTPGEAASWEDIARTLMQRRFPFGVPTSAGMERTATSLMSKGLVEADARGCLVTNEGWVLAGRQWARGKGCYDVTRPA